ncbi:hypothetical protein [Sphingobacterium griseoflavum]|uniref:Uncharacterized protein n=1 Tax=Sphingobacterium griseoflavum TaxID=1474952 RepID=A0ABQ3I1T1_9SPHI|nr:hypothetical protein [Sphingobacterium griseoflavum]GHE45563.1 hypothetical protein GCM10017764_31000 [Sphingobacterium griseoflavum]
MKKKRLAIAAIIVIAFTNLPVVSTTIMGELDKDRFRYANNDASFTYIQEFDILRGWISQWTVWGFIESQRPTQEHMEVFRLYKINPLCFWRWRYYILVSRKFRYKSWQEIEPNRVPFVDNNKWQDF